MPLDYLDRFNQMGADLHARAAVNYVPVAPENAMVFGHSIEPTWSAERLDDINKHFVLATMDWRIKQQEQACVYLQLEGDSNQQAVDRAKTPSWFGFADRYSTGTRTIIGSNAPFEPNLFNEPLAIAYRG